MMPKISIIVPVYNTQMYLNRCLDSILVQTLAEIEVILVDDASGDDSLEILKNYAAKEPRFKVLSNQVNMGLFHTRIIGNQYACGEYILFLDSDDYLLPDACEILYSKAKEYAADMLRFNTLFYPKGFWVNIAHFPEKVCKDASKLLFTPKQGFCPYVWNKIYHKDLVLVVDKILCKIQSKITIGEDILRSFVCILLSKKPVCIGGSYYVYCFNPKSSTNVYSNKVIYRKIKDYHKILEALEMIYADLPSNYQSDSLKIFQKTNKALLYLIYFEKRNYLKNGKKFAYLFSMIYSLKFCFRPQSIIRIFLYILSMGKVSK